MQASVVALSVVALMAGLLLGYQMLRIPVANTAVPADASTHAGRATVAAPAEPATTDQALSVLREDATSTATKVMSMVDPVATNNGQAPKAMLPALTRARDMAARGGIIIPRTFTGPPEMWQAISDVDKAYGVAYSELSNSFGQRLIGLGFSAKPGTLPRVPVDGKTRSDMIKATKHLAGDRTSFVANGAGLHVSHVAPGQDAELDRTENEMNGICAAAADALRHVLDSHHIQYSYR